jgi:soluble lytic murein transglycosylase-like protein
MATHAAGARADCIAAAAAHHDLDADLLRAIAYFESRMNPNAINKNKNGTVDVGLMQINSVHFPRLASQGVDHRRLRDPCLNARVGAAMLSELVWRFGPTWQAVGSYHSRTPELTSSYARSIRDVYLDRPWARDTEPRAEAPRTRGVQVIEVDFR